MSNGKGKQAQCEPVYIASGCNRYSNVADVREQDGLVAYGAGKLVALWRSEVSLGDGRTARPHLFDQYIANTWIQDPTHRGVHQTLPGHAGDVTSVKFLRSTNEALHCSAIITGDSSGTLILWKEDAEQGVRAVTLYRIECFS